MSSFLGHGLAAAVLVSALNADKKNSVRLSEQSTGDEKIAAPRWGWLLAAAITISQVPDFDVLIYIAFEPPGMTPHRGFSHSLLFALFTSCFVSLLSFRWLRVSFCRTFLTLFAAAVSASLFDYLMGCGPEIPFFAPLSWKGYLFPLKAVPTAYFTTNAQGLIPLLFARPMLICFGFEILIFGPLLLASRQAGARRYRLFALSVLSICSSLVLYNL